MAKWGMGLGLVHMDIIDDVEVGRFEDFQFLLARFPYEFWCGQIELGGFQWWCVYYQKY